ncbi:MAG TPA: hypothetical protein VF719_03985, partial [Abditibacteriaceae bacterium]
SNLYTDLLINDRLQRGSDLRIAEVYARLGEKMRDAKPKNPAPDRCWTLYMRTYEILWSMEKGTLAHGAIDAALEGDAGLAARLVRSYANDWLRGAGRFAALCLPYVMEDDEATRQRFKIWLDTQSAGTGGFPDGLVEIEEDEISGAIHPSLDEALSGVRRETSSEESEPISVQQNTAGTGQHREPFEFGEILQGLGIELSPHEIAMRYYRERAVPHLVRFPARSIPRSPEPLPEALEAWDIGAPLDALDWFETALQTPRIVPGLNTVQRLFGVESGTERSIEPVDLDLYVDCSGSMPNPQIQTSFLTLAGAIVALSALRAGSRVQATLWSGKHDFQTSGGFVQDERTILQILTGYIGGATAFPIHLLRNTFQPRDASDRPAHILVISDDGVTTMFDSDERGNSGWDIARMALEKARGGGTLVLNLYREIDHFAPLVRARNEGWNLHRVQNWDDLLAFARDFSRANYERNHTIS